MFAIFEGIFLGTNGDTKASMWHAGWHIVAIPGENDSFLFWLKAALLGVLFIDRSVLETLCQGPNLCIDGKKERWQ